MASSTSRPIPKRQLGAPIAKRGANVTLDADDLARLARVTEALSAYDARLGGKAVTPTEAQRKAIRLGLSILELRLGIQTVPEEIEALAEDLKRYRSNAR